MPGKSEQSRSPQRIAFRCACGKELLVKAEHGGKRLKCPACGQPIAVPTPTMAYCDSTRDKAGSEGFSKRTLIVLWSLVGAFAFGCAVFLVYHICASNQDRIDGANAAVADAMSEAHAWLSSSTPGEGEAVEEALACVLANEYATEKGNGQAVLQQVRRRNRVLKAERAAATIFTEAKRKIDKRRVAEAVSSLREYLSNAHATEKADAAKLLTEAEIARSDTAAIQTLIAMSDEAFDGFRESRTFNDGDVTHPVLLAVRRETLQRNLLAAARKRDEIRSAEETRIEAERRVAFEELDQEERRRESEAARQRAELAANLPAEPELVLAWHAEGKRPVLRIRTDAILRPEAFVVLVLALRQQDNPSHGAPVGFAATQFRSAAGLQGTPAVLVQMAAGLAKRLGATFKAGVTAPGGTSLELFGRKNLLGKPAGCIAGYTKLRNQERSAAAMVAYGALGHWADGTNTLQLESTGGVLRTAGRMQIWFFSKDQIVWTRTFDWPGNQKVSTKRLSHDGQWIAVPPPAPGNVAALAISPDGRILASCTSIAEGDEEAMNCFWSFPDGELLRTFGIDKCHHCTLAFAPDGQSLAVGDFGGAIKVWSVPDGNLLKTLEVSQGIVDQLAISRDGRLLASAGRVMGRGGDRGESTIWLWSLRDGTLLKAWKAHEYAITPPILSHDGNTLISVEGELMKFWSLPQGDLLRSQKEEAVRGLALSPDDQTLISLVHNYRLQEKPVMKFRSFADGTLLKTLDLYRGGSYSRPIISPDGRLLALAETRHRPEPAIQLRSLPDGRLLKYLVGHTGYITGLAISPDGTILVSGSRPDETIRFWSLPDGEMKRCLSGIATF